MTTLFYYTGELYGAFSGWSRHGFELDGQYWQTLEHFYQAQKFAGTAYADEIRLATTPRIAKQLGSRTDWPLRADWEAVKDAEMYRGVMAKVTSHPDVSVCTTSNNPPMMSIVAVGPANALLTPRVLPSANVASSSGYSSPV